MMNKKDTERLQVRMDAQMKKKAQEKALSIGLDLSSYIRFLIAKDLNKDK
jgi:antitoxin component of RelBE/YafQ-DinJ toxin-antitoxin module